MDGYGDWTGMKNGLLQIWTGTETGLVRRMDWCVDWYEIWTSMKDGLV